MTTTQVCLAPSRSTDTPVDGAADRYERLFPDLPRIEGDEERLLGLAGPGSVCDGGDGCPDAVGVAAGWPFFGQLIAHDITADRSPLAHQAAGERAENFRSPRADLECIYGDGPVGNPFLYRRDDPAKLLLGLNDAGEEADLPRNREGIAVIGDPRNDTHIFVSQLHLAGLRLHNRVVDHLRRSAAVPESAIFDEARRTVSWLYQWVIVNDYLPRLVGPELVGEIEAEGPRHYRPGPAPRIPLEFADAAFRYGHSQVREDFELNSRSGRLRLFPDLLGFRPDRRRARDRVGPALRRPRPPAGAAGEADRRQARALADRAATGDHRRGRSRGVSLPRRTRPPTRTRVRPPLRRDRRACDGRDAR